MFSVQASGTNGDVFYGVMVCCTDTMMAFGYVENEKEDQPSGSTAACARLNNGQFAAFFPEFASFSCTILAVDQFTSSENQGWIAFGCADGLVRVLQGQIHGGCIGGPFKTKDLQLNGPVTSVALFPDRTSGEVTASWRCNLLVTCAIGQAVVYTDLLSTDDGTNNGEVLVDSDTFDSIFAGITADIDLVSGFSTQTQVLLAYKKRSGNDSNEESVDDSKRDAVFEDATKDLAESSVDSPDSSHNIWSTTDPIQVADAAIHSASGSALASRRCWQRLTRSSWDLETFGAIYSLLWRDVNHDGVPELLVASSTGVYVYEADPAVVVKKLQAVLSALTAATSTTAPAPSSIA
ncbi:unnamed protein product [Phytophthora fragariaefolia]|uniref:Unnamed protein product n=1 Tax=Phytophthora fragariaefolia TaxID=1490495 RepID=A0A9W6XXM0_9STRA|nr:unnamed protein product [Phytophthora fragariaefolia]